MLESEQDRLEPALESGIDRPSAIDGLLRELARAGSGQDEELVRSVMGAVRSMSTTVGAGQSWTVRPGSLRAQVRGRVGWFPRLSALAASLAVVSGLWWVYQGIGTAPVEVKATAAIGLRVADVFGEASIQRSTSKTQEAGQESVVIGMEMRQGDRVAVQAGGKVALKYDGEETTIDLCSAIATFGADQGAKRVKLDSGLLLCTAAPQAKPFRLETPNGLATVVGTRFALDAGKSETMLAVREGAVVLSHDQKSLEVKAGETAVVAERELRRISDADAWARELLVRAEAGPWDAADFGKGAFAQGDWRMDARGSPAERSIWNVSADAQQAMALAFVPARWKRAIVTGRMMILADGQQPPEPPAECLTANPQWRISNIQTPADPTREASFLLCRSDTEVVSWGYTNRGSSATPSPTGNFIAVAAGDSYSLALKSDGSLAAWGANTLGQCSVPSPNGDFVALAAGWSHALGLKSDGRIVGWGANLKGVCEAPISVPSPNRDFVAIATGWAHSLGLKRDGSVVAWGNNEFGQCNVPSPNSGFVAIAVGDAHAAGAHSLGLKKDGSIVAWGANDFQQCEVPSPNRDFVGIAAGWCHSLGLKGDGSVVAWGQNNTGQCTVPDPNRDFAAIAASRICSVGLKRDGRIVAWGGSSVGLCSVPGPNERFTAIAAGPFHNLGVRATSRLDSLGPDKWAPLQGFGAALEPAGAWYRIAIYFDTDANGAPCVRTACWPEKDGCVPTAEQWGRVRTTLGKGDFVGLGLLAKNCRMQVSELKLVPLGPEMANLPDEGGLSASGDHGRRAMMAEKR